MSANEEQVMCFSVDKLKGREFQGISKQPELYEDLLKSENNFYLPRSKAELDTTAKQIIPYVIITSGDKIFTYLRAKKGGERRLHDKYSIGVGGHINSADPTYHFAVAREMNEEVGVMICPTLVAAINDDSHEVGKVHFGFVHLLENVIEEMLSINEELAEPKFMPIKEAVNSIDKFEGWSQLCLRNIDEILK